MSSQQQNNKVPQRPFDAVLTVPCKDNGFYFWWVQFLKPVHKMSNFPCKVFALLLEERENQVSKSLDDEAADAVLFTQSVTNKICESLGIDIDRYWAALSILRKHKVLSGRRINKRYVPERNGGNSFKLLINFSV